MGRLGDRLAELTIQIAQGNVPGLLGVNKFGSRADVDINPPFSDIWSRASQPVWVAPTAARIHNIASDSPLDVFPAGAGARTGRVFGLKTWADVETFEDVELDGVNDVPTVESYVIIHRMEAVGNVGTITATAVAPDGTVTAQIDPDVGKTRMAILGIPSTQNLFLLSYYAGFTKSGGSTGAVDIDLRVNPEPDVRLLSFLTEHTQSILSTGTSHFEHPFPTPLPVEGPAILKLTGSASVNNLNVSGGFNGILELK